MQQKRKIERLERYRSKQKKRGEKKWEWKKDNKGERDKFLKFHMPDLFFTMNPLSYGRTSTKTDHDANLK